MTKNTTILFSLAQTKNGDQVLSLLLDGTLRSVTSDDPDLPEIITLITKINAGKKVTKRTDQLRFLLLPVGQRIINQLGTISDRVTYDEANDALLLDGKPTEGFLSRHLLTQFQNKAPIAELEALVKFLEKLDLNPSHRSRDRLFVWLNKHGLTLTSDGDIIAYKGLTNEDTSVHSGTASVNGQEITGQIPQAAGDTIAMPRREISDDPSVTCHVGLHAGNLRFAMGFGGHRIATVLIHPAHVVCVPVDSNAEKMRVENYLVLEVTDKATHVPVEPNTVVAVPPRYWFWGSPQDVPTHEPTTQDADLED